MVGLGVGARVGTFVSVLVGSIEARCVGPFVSTGMSPPRLLGI